MSGPPIDRVVVINDRSAMVGGASNLSILLAKRLEASGIETTFFAGDSSDGNKPVSDTIHLDQLPITQQSRSRALTTGLYNPTAYSRLKTLIEKRDTPNTIYHVHGWSKILSPSIFRALRGVRARTVLHAHDYFLACPNGGFANYQTSTACQLRAMSWACLTTQCDKRSATEKYWRVVRHALRQQLFPIRNRPARIIFIHEKMKEYFERSGIPTHSAHTIRNPIEPVVSTQTRPWSNSRIYFVGRIEHEKGIEDAAAAAEEAGVALHCVGDGSGRHSLEKKYPGVVIHGWKTKDEMRPLLEQARAVVMCSRLPEPFGLAIVEAISSGIPVIIPDTALLSDEIVKYSCGLRYKSGDHSALVSAMASISGNDDMVREMSANGQRSASKLALSIDAWIDAITDLYASEILSSKE